MSHPLVIQPTVLQPTRLPAGEVHGLYVHIPFCFHKCHYCDFYSITRQNVERMQAFVKRILAEAEVWALADGPSVRPRTAFFGGGTPSLLPLEQMSQLINGLRQRFNFGDIEEWTVEVNPATASAEYLHMLREHGVDRISLGAQSFDPAELKTLERHHDPDDVPRTLDQARTAGFQRLSIDLIYAIPGQTMQSWSQSLEAAIKLGLTHYSCYGLTYEPNTPIAVRKRLGMLRPTDEQIELQMFHHTRRRLAKAGCPAYEISNYASAGQECKHNLLYWMGGDYIGLGPSAASHVRGWRFKNRPHLGEWESSIDRGELPATEVETLSPRQRAGELIMLLLRLSGGVEFKFYEARTGRDARQQFANQLGRLSKPELIEVDDRGFRLTEKGLAVADAIAAEFLAKVG